ncbi:MAG: type II secretion system protein M [Proteobacteria bacterium]|nr:type II secretion system protein M [Pseudomonadota bacterium]MBU1686257.1 type II secretion system protein M [Pseudomonadota bacterium]
MTFYIQQRRPLILLVIASILLVMVALNFLLPIDLGGGGGELAGKEMRIVNLEQRLARKGVLQQEFLELSRQLAGAETGLLNGRTPALAAVDLQNRLTELVTGTGAAMTSQRVLPSPRQNTTTPSPYVEIPVQIAASLTVRQLKDLLYGISASPVFMQIREAEVRVVKQEEGILLATLTVSGVMPMVEESREGAQ